MARDSKDQQLPVPVEDYVRLFTDPAQKPRIGKPTTFNPQIALVIIEGIQADNSLRSLCEPDFMPTIYTVLGWIKRGRLFPDRYPHLASFAQLYLEARDLSGDRTYDKLIELEQKLEAGVVDWKTASVLMQSMQWRAGKMRPRIYGERIMHAGHDGGPIKHAVALEESITDAKRKARQQERLVRPGDDAIDVTPQIGGKSKTYAPKT